MTAAAPISKMCGGVKRLSRPVPRAPNAGDQNAWSTIHAAPKMSAATKLPVSPSGNARFHGRPARSPVAKPANRNSVRSDHEAVTTVKPASSAGCRITPAWCT